MKKHMDSEKMEKGMKDKETGPGETMPVKHEQSSDKMNECKTMKGCCPTGK